MREICNKITIMKLKAYIDKLEKDKLILMQQLINKYHNELWHDVNECTLRLSEINFALNGLREIFKEELEYKYEME